MTDDLYTRSGRESLSPGDRIELLRADIMQEPFLGISSETRATSQTIHDLKLTIEAVRGTIKLYEEALARGQTKETLAKGANKVMSNIECVILAWRRGGHREYQRIRKLQGGSWWQ